MQTIISQTIISRRPRLNGILAVMATLAVGGGLFPSVALAQKNINFTDTGSVNSTLVFSNQINPDVYSFFAAAGERIRVQTSNNTGLDTTIRVVGPDASINLFDDDGGSTPQSPLASRLVFTATDSGAYIVVVSSFSGNPGGGNYTLNFARGNAALQAIGEVSTEPNPGKFMPEVTNPVQEKP